MAGRIQSALDDGASPAEVAVFYRMNAQSRVLEDLLTRQGIDYRVIGGPKFYERAEIKDAIAYLQVLENPADEVSLRRIVNQPRRGIGTTSLDRLSAHGADAGRDAVGGDRATSRTAPLGAAAAASVTALPGADPGAPRGADTAPGGRPDGAGAAGERLRWRCSRPSARSSRRAGSRTCASWSAWPASSTSAASRRRSRRGLSAFLQEISLYTDQDALDDDRGRVTLMTLHNAKGLEFPVVFMIGLEEGLFPHQRSLEERNEE